MRHSPVRQTPVSQRLRRIEVPEMGAEDVVIDGHGNAWTGTADGSIFRVQAYDDAGLLVCDIDGDASRYHMVTGLREHHGEVWLASLHEPALAILSLSTDPVQCSGSGH